jgi:predicted choloylglycine hydrolase
MLLLCFLLYFFAQIRIEYPDVPVVEITDYKPIQISENEWVLDDSWLKKNKFGVWEVFIAGDDYERGIKYGVLTKKLMELQEDYFVAQINEIIPNSFYLNFLKLFVAWFNKDMPEYIPMEYQKEIYGVSLSFSDKYDYIAPKYYRILNYHAAHDIGHALTDLSMVGCTSFGVSGAYTKDSALIIGRNFDFYMGDDFAKDKLVTFMQPTSGYNYVSYSWAGLMGVVSGMNEKGLTVTINASKSDLPFGAKMPISLLAREILQYASNHEEAIAIAKKREVFVSETLMIGSKEDNSVMLLEKSPEKFDSYSSGIDYTVCANHYQSDAYLKDSSNILNIKNSDSYSRFSTMDSLIVNSEGIDPIEVARILRFKEDDKGMGNPKLINQMIAHHACIFKPEDGLAWFSSGPYQMGPIFCYDL